MSGVPVEPTVAAELVRRYGLAGATLEPIAGGLINATYLARRGDAPPLAVIQRLHPVFGPEVNLDLEAITGHLAAHGLETPRLLRTTDDRAWVTIGGATWRAITFVEGYTVDKIDRPARAEAAGELVGRFHRAVDGLEHRYAFARAGVHDTAAHLGRLRAAVGDPAHGHLHEAVALGGEILAAAADLPPLGELPLRHTHGDLKISNVLFRSDAPEAVCLIDLDTLGRQSIAYELGDALRSWCNPHGEDVIEPVMSLPIFGAAVTGYARGAAGLLRPDEVASIVPGMHTVCIELAARFCVDACEDRYFGWDPSRFSSRREHNLVRARGQLALGRSVAAHAADANELVHAAFA